ncbi:DUF7283 family protein [Halostagnicola larsenii]
MKERWTTQVYEASSTYEHDADEIRVDGPTISLRNEHGTTHSRLSYGTVVPVMGDERLENITSGTPFETEYSDELDDPDTAATEMFFDDLEAANANNSGEWVPADGEMRTRTVDVVSPSVAVSVKPEEWGTGDTTRSMRFSYEANTETQIEISATGTLWGKDEPQTETELVEADEDGRSYRYSLHTGESPHNQIHYPFDVDVRAGGQHVCSETITDGDHGEKVAVCDGTDGNVDTTDDLEWVDLNEQTGNYRVTLVDS